MSSAAVLLGSLWAAPSPAPDPAKAATSIWAGLWHDGDGPLAKLVQILVIIAIAVVVRLIAHQVVGIFVSRIVSGVKRRQRAEDTQALLASPVSAARVVQRTRTLGSVLNNVVSVIVAIVALLSIITTLNSNLTGAFSLITAALGAGLGFGAQNPVKDVLTGLFMVADDQLGVGDVVNTDLASGVVEAVGIRVTQIRDVNGVLWYVRNGEITRVGNMSQGWSRAVVDVTVPRNADVDAVQHRMLEVATALLAEDTWKHSVVERPELWGLESVTADAVVLRLVVKTRTNTRDDVAWALRVQMKEALEAGGLASHAISTTALDRFEQPGVLRAARPLRTTSPVGSRRSTRPRARADAGEPGARPQRPAAPATGISGMTGPVGVVGLTGPATPPDGVDGR